MLRFLLRKISCCKIVFTLLLFIISYSVSGAAESSDNTDLEIFYIDNPNNRLQISDIIKVSQQGKLQRVNDALNLGFETGNIWIEIQVDSSIEEQMLMITNAHLDWMDIYFYSGNTLLRNEQSGDHLPFEARFTDNIFFNFSIPKGTTSIYMQVKTEGPMIVPVKILSFPQFVKSISKNVLLHYIYFGILFLTFLTSIFMYFWLRDSISIYYSLFLFSIAFITALDFGYGFQYIWPDLPGVNKFNTVFYCLSFTTLLFAEKLLNLKVNSPRLHKAYRFIYLIFFISAIAAVFIPYSVSIRGLFVTSLIIPLLSFISGVYLYAKVKNEYTRFYLYGWAVFMVSVVIYITSVAGFLPRGEIATNMIQIGSTIEIIFFNLAVLSRLGLLQKEKQQILSEQNLILEQKVAERTFQLEEKNEVIESNNKLLQDHKMHLEKLVEERTKDIIDKNQRLEHFADLTHHNLRGPVATLLGLCNIYNAKNHSDPFNTVVFDNICQTVSNMDNIVRNLGQLLNTEKEIGSLIAPVNLQAVLSEAKTMLETQIIRSGAEIEGDFSALPEVNAVPAYLNNIFFQLLSNAIKFRKPDAILHVKVKSYKEKYCACLEFKDDGLGIDVERFGDQLFKPFKRFHSHSDGRGLGLSIVKRQVEVMGGEISMTSSPGMGTTILIRFKVSKR